MTFGSPIKLWLWLSTVACFAGWSLSACGQLNQVGYIGFFIPALVLFFQSHKSKTNSTFQKASRWKKNFQRFRRPLPATFLGFSILILLGGMLYSPTNYTGLTYRVERVLQWLAHGQWIWIHTPNYRMNDRACGIEWLYAPIILFTKSDRALFLANFLPFVLMPGLIFSIFTKLGVSARVAWRWMWLLPTGYNFLLQAGSVANDTFPTVFALAAIHFGLQAHTSQRVSDLWYAILAAALLTGAKASNLPLLLPCAILIFPLLPLLLKNTFRSIGIILIALTVSFLPNAVLNIYYCHDWTGAILESQGLAMNHPLVGIWGNALLLIVNHLIPPLFPLAGWWNQHALDWLPHFLATPMIANFEPGFQTVGELPTEDWIGLGMGLAILLGASVLAGWFCRAKKTSNQPFILRLVLFSSWLALLAYAAKSGMVTPQRLIAPYYPLLIASLLIGSHHVIIVRKTWWKFLCASTIFSAFIILVLAPDRPLWPAKTILTKLAAQHPQSANFSRALNVYTTYSLRSDPLVGVRNLLPPDATNLGFVAGPDDMDVSLWRPFGGRTVQHFFATEPPKDIGQQVPYAVVAGYNLTLKNIQLTNWLAQSGGKIIATTNATLKLNEGAQPWYIVKFEK